MALETIEFEGKSYVPSKQAAEATGYTQDYIGQLARNGSVLARRVGGLWYINMEDLERHKKDSEAYVPEPPTTNNDRSGSIVSFDGKEYVSSKRASEITRYTQDYVGQLARGGKIKSRQVGGRWYVSKDDLMEHKRQKDALLAAVQADAVGVERQVVDRPVTEEPLLTYLPSEGSDLPTLTPKEPEIEQYNVSRNDISDSLTSTESEDESAIHHIAIRAMGRDVASKTLEMDPEARTESGIGYSRHHNTWDASQKPEKIRSKRKKYLVPTSIAVLFVALGGVLYVSGVVPKSLGAIVVRVDARSGFEVFTERVVEALSSTETYQRN